MLTVLAAGGGNKAVDTTTTQTPRRRGRIVTALLGAVLAALLGGRTARGQGEWRQPDVNAAHSRYLPGSIAPPLRVVWSLPLPFSASPAVAAGDSLYLLGNNSSRTYTVLALRARDGRTLWPGPTA